MPSRPLILAFLVAFMCGCNWFRATGPTSHLLTDAELAAQAQHTNDNNYGINGGAFNGARDQQTARDAIRP